MRLGVPGTGFVKTKTPDRNDLKLAWRSSRPRHCTFWVEKIQESELGIASLRQFTSPESAH